MIETPAPIQRFLEGIQTANWDGMEKYYTPDTIYDATVPGWHYQYQGRDRVLEELRNEWTGKHPWKIIEVNISATPNGAVVDFEARGEHPGDEHSTPHIKGVRMANIFRIEDGRIAEHRFYCGGEWDEETLRRIEAEAPRIQRNVMTT